MDPGWDHTENEDKLLLTHTLGMGKATVTNDDIYVSEVRSMSRIVCSNDNMGSRDRLISLSSEYSNQLLSFVSNILNTLNNNYNEIYDFFNFVSNFILLLSNSLCCINKIINLIPCIKSNLSPDKYLCRPNLRDFETCLNEINTKINCLKTYFCSIYSRLICIKCYLINIKSIDIYNINNPCNKSLTSPVKYYYDLIKSKVTSIHLCVDKSKIKIKELTDLKVYLGKMIKNLDILTCSYSKGCGCLCIYVVIFQSFKNVKSQIENALCQIEIIIKNYGTIQYNTIILKYSNEFAMVLLQFSNKSLYKFFRCSLQSISKNLINFKNSNIRFLDINDISIVQINNVVMSVYSHYSLLSSLFFLIRVIQWAEFINDFLNTNDIPDRCSCVKSFELNKIDKFYIKGYSNYTHNIDTSILSKLYKQTHGNHICLCLVMKYVFYPSIMSLLYYVFGTNLEIHGTFNRRFDNYNYLIGFNNDVSKMLLFIFHIISVIINIILKDSYVKWSSRTEVKCFCMSDKYDKNYILTISLYLSSLMENIWSMDRQTFEVFVKNLSSFMWEFDVITKNNKFNIVKLEIPSLKLFSMTVTEYIKTISFKTETKNGNCNGNSQILLHTQIGKSQAILINNNVKSFFKSVLSSISILIKTPLFSLVYSNISGLAFYLIGNGKIIGLSSGFLRNVVKSISVTYLDCAKKKECLKKCCSSKECKICVVSKIIYLTINITLNMIRYVLRSVIKHLMVDSLKLTTKVKIEFVRSACVNSNIQMLRMTKNNLTNKDPVLRSYGSIGVTNVETRNWGYDTKYEHDVTNDKGFTYNYPDISNNTASYASSRMFKLILSRLLVGGVIVFIFIYIVIMFQDNIQNSLTSDITNDNNYIIIYKYMLNI